MDAGADSPDADAGEDELDDGLDDYRDWSLFPDGAPVPDLPPGSPPTVRFGAFLIPYEGAEYAPKDAPTREQAQTRARELLKLARSDFELASEDAHAGGPDLGRIHRGILEPALELALFSLKPGEIHPDPVDSPRGFWVLKRLK